MKMNMRVLCFILFVLATNSRVVALASKNTCERFSAIVIGAGPAGLAVSLGLSSLESCERVHLVEKQPTFDARGANFFLACNGLKALEEQSPGISEEFKRVGIVSDMVPEYPAILLPWWEMRDVLLERVRNMKKVSLYTGKELNKIVNSDDGVTVYFENDKDLVLKGDFLVGADGVHSSVRKQLNLPEGTELGLQSTIRGHVNNANEIEEIAPLLDKGFIPLSGNFGIDGMLGSVFNYDSKLPGKLAWVVGTKEPFVEGETTTLDILDPTKSKQTDKQDLEMFRALVKNTDKDNFHVFPQGRVMDFSQDVLDGYKGRWGGDGRVTLLGDAAHAFPSADGQGGSQAFEDGVVLTRRLREQETNENFETILANFEKERLPRIKKLHDDQTERFAISMNGGAREMWTKDFMAWVFEGV